MTSAFQTAYNPAGAGANYAYMVKFLVIFSPKFAIKRPWVQRMISSFRVPNSRSGGRNGTSDSLFKFHTHLYILGTLLTKVP
jgi:hypothetical protein